MLFRSVVPADDLQGRAGAVWAGKLGLKNVYVLDDTELYGKGIADVFANEAPGAGLTVLSGSFSSPTLARLVSELRTRFPRMLSATYDAVSDENRLAGLRQATGRDAVPPRKRVTSASA